MAGWSQTLSCHCALRSGWRAKISFFWLPGCWKPNTKIPLIEVWAFPAGSSTRSLARTEASPHLRTAGGGGESVLKMATWLPLLAHCWLPALALGLNVAFERKRQKTHACLLWRALLFFLLIASTQKCLRQGHCIWTQWDWSRTWSHHHLSLPWRMMVHPRFSGPEARTHPMLSF